MEAKKNSNKNLEIINNLKANSEYQQNFQKVELDLAEYKDDNFTDNLTNQIQSNERREQSVQENDFYDTSKKYKKELLKVMEQSDIVLEILDARDPLSCRCKEIERDILALPGEKKIILVLNKIDLVPKEITEQWLKYLKREFATILFKANTQRQADKLGESSLFQKNINKKEDMVNTMLQNSKAVGADNLLQLIKNYSKKNGIKRAVTVGLIGYPNVGKSSVINSLKKTRAVGVSSVAGFTKNIQEITLDKKVKLLDCPGILFDKTSENSLILRNAIKVEDIIDPVNTMTYLLQKISQQELYNLYKVQNYSNVMQFLGNLAQNRGKMKRQGIPDIEAAARIVLHDVNNGKLRYYTFPPVIPSQENQGDMNIESNNNINNFTSQQQQFQFQQQQPQQSNQMILE